MDEVKIKPVEGGNEAGAETVGEPSPSPEKILEEIGYTEPSVDVPPEPEPEKPKRKRRKRGRPSKQEILEEQAVNEMQAKAEHLIETGIKALVVGAAELVARYLKDDRWKVTDAQEAAELAGVIKAYLDLRLPDVANTPEAMLILGLSGYVFRRLDFQVGGNSDE